MAHRHRVLVVEDDPDSAEALEAVFDAHGIDTVVAADGGEALDCLQRDADELCVVLLDLMMPRMDGWEFRLHQTRDPHLVRIPVIAVSGGGALAEKVSTLHASAYLMKPLDPAAVITAVDRLCADSHGAPATA